MFEELVLVVRHLGAGRAGVTVKYVPHRFRYIGGSRGSSTPFPKEKKERKKEKKRRKK